MATLKKKKVRDFEEEDIDLLEEQEESGNLVERLAENKNYIIIGLGALVLLVAGIFFYNSWSSGQNVEANEKAFRAFQYLDKDSLSLAINGDASYSGLATIADQYGSTKTGNLSKYATGIAYLRQGNTEQGVKYLKDYSKGKDLMGMAAYMALGFAHEDLGQHSDAASYFEKGLNSVQSNDHTTPIMLMQAARSYELAGNKSKALQLYKRVKADYSQSLQARDIDKYIGMLDE